MSQIEPILDAVYAWSRKQDYRGWNKHDGLNSPILNGLLGWGRWPRMVAIQGVMRFPLNIRALLLTPKTYNPKGLALFTQGLLERYQTEGQAHYLDEAQRLLGRLDTLVSPGQWSGLCWGYHYPWCDPGFYAPTNTPNAVVTSFVCEAMLDAYQVTQKQKYLDTVERVIPFFLQDLTLLKDESDELCLAYMPLSMTMRVMDVSILIGSVIARYASLSGEPKWMPEAQRLVRYVVNQQTSEGAWFYTDPPSDSRIKHDNYHTGFILDALARYMAATGDQQWQNEYQQGLTFYAEHLFNADGSPRWMSHLDFPHDIHGAAQGILTFSRHLETYPGLAQRIAKWALDNMYHPEGRFYYQQMPRYKKRFTLLRWCNGWMARALAALLRRERQAHG
jgi:rhamnogalacturonyl hydrolase YesR